MSVRARFVFLISAFCSIGSTATLADTSSSCTQHDSGQCSRVELIRSRWHSTELGHVSVLAGVSDSTEENTALCRYNSDEDRIEVAEKAFSFSNNGLERCLAQAFSQAKYEEIEAMWLKHLGIRETWVLRKGTPEKVTISRGSVEPASARTLWVSLATRELLAARAEFQNRQPATSTTTGSSVSSDPMVRELLGMH